MRSAQAIAIFMLLASPALLLSCKSAPPSSTELVSAPLTPTPPASAPRASLDGTYSNMKSIKGVGNAIGFEVTVSNSQGDALVTFQCAQGELPQPQQVAAVVSAMTLRFHTRTNEQCPGASYTATLAGATLTLTQDGAATPAQVLQRVTKPGERPIR
jgi:hypothetical protein